MLAWFVPSSTPRDIFFPSLSGLASLWSGTRPWRALHDAWVVPRVVPRGRRDFHHAGHVGQHHGCALNGPQGLGALVGGELWRDLVVVGADCVVGLVDCVGDGWRRVRSGVSVVVALAVVGIGAVVGMGAAGARVAARVGVLLCCRQGGEHGVHCGGVAEDGVAGSLDQDDLAGQVVEDRSDLGVVGSDSQAVAKDRAMEHGLLVNLALDCVLGWNGMRVVGGSHRVFAEDGVFWSLGLVDLAVEIVAKAGVLRPLGLVGMTVEVVAQDFIDVHIGPQVQVVLARDGSLSGSLNQP